MRGYVEALRQATKVSSGGPERHRPECTQEIPASVQVREDTDDP